MARKAMTGRSPSSRTLHLHGSLDWGSGWSTVVSEINAHRPLIAVWDWWNPINPDHRWGDGFAYCDLGPNIEPAPNENVGGHAVTIVGYIDDGGGGMGRVIAHDNWYTTDRDIVMKWKETARTIYALCGPDHGQSISGADAGDAERECRQIESAGPEREPRRPRGDGTDRS